MKGSASFPLLLGGVLTLVVTSCQQDASQQAKPTLQVESITSRDAVILHDTAVFNKVMNAPVTPDSIPIHR